MSPTLSIHELAETEINEAADFHDVESPGLGGIFLDEVQRALAGIVDSSSTHQKSSKPPRS